MREQAKQREQQVERPEDSNELGMYESKKKTSVARVERARAWAAVTHRRQ